jgi:hypothetical protein
VKLAALLLALVPLAACGAEQIEVEVDNATLARVGVESLAGLLAHAPERVAHRGVRRIESHYAIDGAVHDIAYTEEIVTDGLGGFLIEPLSAIGEVPPSFMHRLRMRIGFAFQYRDFRVRDLELFEDNYQFVRGGRPVIVAGRSASEFVVKSRVNEGRFYTVAMDLATGLVLRCVEESAEGQVLASMEYLTFEDAPDLAGVAMYQRSNAEVDLDPQGDLYAELGFEPLIPTDVPEGYRLSRLSRVLDPTGRRWAKLTFTDGVESLFFLNAGGSSMPDGPTDDVVQVYEVGPISIAQGEVREQDLMGVGKVPTHALLSMLTSALPE